MLSLVNRLKLSVENAFATRLCGPPPLVHRCFHVYWSGFISHWAPSQ